MVCLLQIFTFQGVILSLCSVTHIHVCCLFASLEQWAPPCSSRILFLHLTQGCPKLVKSDLWAKSQRDSQPNSSCSVTGASSCQRCKLSWQSCYIPDRGFFTNKQENGVSTWTLSSCLSSPIWGRIGFPWTTCCSHKLEMEHKQAKQLLHAFKAEVRLCWNFCFWSKPCILQAAFFFS